MSDTDKPEEPRKVINYAEHKAGVAARRKAIEPFLVGIENVVRERPRAATEAAFLRRIGTPERLIGPVISDEEWARSCDHSDKS